jgi:hypothetical protein
MHVRPTLYIVSMNIVCLFFFLEKDANNTWRIRSKTITISQSDHFDCQKQRLKWFETAIKRRIDVGFRHFILFTALFSLTGVIEVVLYADYFSLSRVIFICETSALLIAKLQYLILNYLKMWKNLVTKNCL